MTDTSGRPGIHALVLAAGQSRRVGRPKQVLTYGQTTITGTVVRTLLETDVQSVTVVTQTALIDDLELPRSPRVAIATNDEPKSEMIDSVRIGLSAPATGSPGDGILVVPGDMPRLMVGTVRRCIDAFRNDAGCLVVATYAGRRGHPLILPHAMTDHVATLSGGLNTLVHAHQDRLVEVPTDDPGVIENINTPEDYDRLRAGTGDDCDRTREQ